MISHLLRYHKMASPEQIAEKIKECEETGKNDEIYFATDNEDILKEKKLWRCTYIYKLKRI